MLLECSACSCKKNYDPADNGEALPTGWRMHYVASHSLFLCSGCGCQVVGHGGMSPLLRKLLTDKGYKLDGPD